MKLNKNFALRQVAGTWVVMPIAEATVNFNGMLALNETGAVLWRALEEGADKAQLVSALTAEFDVSEDAAAEDVDEFVSKLVDIGCIDIQ